MSGLSLRVLGELEVIRDGAVLPLPPSKKTRGLLAYLALNERSLRRQQLCELLWEIPDDPRGSLRWSLSKIRKLVDEDEHQRVIADRNTVSLDSSSMDIDVRRLHQLVSNGLQNTTTEALEQAADTYQGTFLEGLELPDFHDFHTWYIGQSEQALRSQATLLRSLITRLEDSPEKALVYATRLAGLLPYDKPARASVIGLLIQLDRKPEAEQQYRMGLQKLEEVGDEDASLLYLARRGRGAAQTVTAPPEAAGDRQPASIDDHPTDHDLVGRDNEVAMLTSLLEELPNAKRASVVLIRGNPGMGKTSLLQLTARLARKMGIGILKASAFESEQIRPFAVWNDALRRAMPDNTATKLLSSGERITRDQAFTSLNDLLCEQTSIRPVVILFDDVQWCDESSVSALHYVLRVSPRQPFLLVAASREAELKENSAVLQAVRSLRHDGLLQDLRLGALSPNEISTLISAKCPGVDATRLGEQSAGNPLLAIELARAEAAGEGGGGHSLAELVQERVSRLDSEAAEVLLWSAVMSPRIELNALARVTKFEPGTIDLAIEVAAQQGILHPGPRGFRFSHGLICRCIYEEIPASRRQIMHHRVAEMLEEAAVGDLELASDLAHHAALSGDPALAARAMVSAGKLCLRFHANEDALELYKRGMQFVAELAQPERVCLSLELCDIRQNAAPLEDWEAEVDEYIRLSEQALDFGALSHARVGYQLASYVRWMHGQWSGAQRDSLQAERVTRAGTDEAHILGMAEAAKCLVMLERDLSQADAMAMEANALAQRTKVQCTALPSALGLLRYYEGRLDDAVDHLEEARTVCKAKGDRLNEYIAAEYLVNIEIEREDYEAALARCRPLLVMGARMREGSEHPYALALEALCRYGLEGEGEGLDECFDLVRQADAKQRLTYLLNRAAMLDIRRGQLAKALERSSEALQLAELMERPSEILLARINLAVIANKNNGTVDGPNKASIEALSAGQVAQWAREKAAALLSEQE
jgi:DNA-binding SARP family transcriptional activator